MSFKFIHAADIHLDSPLRGLQRYDTAPVEAIRGAARKALERLVNLAIDRQVAFVLIAGDLYDGDWQDFNTGLFFIQQARRLQSADIPLYLISGNHDAQNQMTRTLSLPENTRMLSVDQPETVCLESVDVAIHGQGFAKREVLDDLTIRYPAATNGLFNIGMLHTCFDGKVGHEPYAPCKLEVLQSRGYDYWALGHIHMKQVLCERPYVAFAGNIQGRHMRETGPKGCLLVSVDDKHRVTTQFEALDILRWEIANVDVTDCSTIEDVFFEIARERRRIEDATPELPLAVRVVLQGLTPLHERLVANQEKYINEVRGRAGNDRVWIEKVLFQTKSACRRVEPANDLLPWEEMSSCVAELRANPTHLSMVAPEVAELLNKLPADLDLRSEGLKLDDETAWPALLDDVESLLSSRLSSTETDE